MRTGSLELSLLAGAHAELPALYNEYGLLVPTRNNRYLGEYFDCIRFFAGRIAAARQTPTLPVLERFPDFDDVPDAFEIAPVRENADQPNPGHSGQGAQGSAMPWPASSPMKNATVGPPRTVRFSLYGTKLTPRRMNGGLRWRNGQCYHQTHYASSLRPSAEQDALSSQIHSIA